MRNQDRSEAAPRRGRLFLLGAPVVVAGLVALFLATRPEPPRYDIVVVTVDTWRFDAIRSADMPVLHAFAARSRRYTAARTPVPLTLPAHVSLLSGRRPAFTGIRDNSSPPLPPADQRPFRLFAEEATEAGYETAAFVASGVLDRRYGLDAGFKTYEGPPAAGAGRLRFPELGAKRQVDRALAWLEARRKGRPYFLWLHLFDPHAPYEVYDGSSSPDRAATAAMDPPAARYAGECRRVDEELARLLAVLDLERTIVCITSDHGESLGEHGEATHGYLCYGATMRVPFLLAGPGIEVGEDPRPSSLVDLVPTLRRLCGFDPAPSDGRDLLATPDPSRVVLGESLYVNRLYGWAQQSVASDGRYSLLAGGPRLELFDLKADPAETRPLPDPTRHAAYRRLDEALQAYRTGDRDAQGAAVRMTQHPYGSQRRSVGAFLPPDQNAKLRDARAALPDVLVLERARAAVGRDAAALEEHMGRLRDLALRDPGNPAPWLELGRAQKFLRRHKASIRSFDRTFELGYRSEGVWVLRIGARVLAGEPALLAEARRLYGEAREELSQEIRERLDALFRGG